MIYACAVFARNWIAIVGCEMRNTWRARFEQQRRQQQQADRDRRATWRLCLHEASHAAACVALGVSFSRVAVWFDDTLRQRGVVELENAGSADQQSLLVVHLAGPASDVFFYGRDLDLYGSDNGNAISVADDIARVEGGDWYAIVQHGRRRAEELVARHAEPIKQLAHELMRAREHELPGQECMRILTAAGVQRAEGRGGMRTKPPAVSSPGRGPEQYYERRDGHDVATRTPDPRRVTTVYLRRVDGYVA
jgi:hypothetical protein